MILENNQNLNSFNFHNKVTFHIHGEGKLNDYLQFQYEHFREQSNCSDKIESNVNLICKKSTISPEIAFKNGQESYGIDNDSSKFFWSFDTSYLLLDGDKKLFDQSDLVFDKSFNNMKANSVLDLILRLHFISSDFVLVHAAAVSKNGRGVLLPAWKSMGKTATCMKLVESGYDYLGDDKVWLNAESEVLSYPRYAVLKDSNINHFPEFITFKTNIKLKLKTFITKFQIFNRSSFLQRIINVFLNIPPQHKYIADLYPNSKTLNKTSINKLIYINKLKQSKSVSFQNIDKEEVQENLLHIGNVEWNYELLFLASAHDILFPNAPKWTEEINNLIHLESQVLRKTFSQVSSSQVNIPAEEKYMNWDKFLAEVEKS